MKSMTGFGFASGGGKDYRLEVNIKSVNSRFTDVKFYTSPFYFSLEKELKPLIFNNCFRGQWVVRMDRFPPKPPPLFSISRDQKQAFRWQKLYKNLSREMGIKNNLDVSHLARLEGVVNTIEKTPPLDPSEKAKVISLFKKALQSCLREKTREGQVLKKDVMGNLTLLQKSLGKIREIHQREEGKAEARYKKISQTEKDMDRQVKFTNLSKKRTKGPAGSLNKKEAPVRHLSSWQGLEGYFDVSEEIVRMEAHLKNCKKLVGQKGPMGKKLDFYTQEILRELNTIGSKSQTALMTSQVVDSKFALEKIKEQVQNIE